MTLLATQSNDVANRWNIENYKACQIWLEGYNGVSQIFLSNVGRLNEDRFTKYYCNKCAKEYPGSPSITYENPNEEVGQGIILIEKGQYSCRICNNIIALYRKFNK